MKIYVEKILKETEDINKDENEIAYYTKVSSNKETLDFSVFQESKLILSNILTNKDLHEGFQEFRLGEGKLFTNDTTMQHLERTSDLIGGFNIKRIKIFKHGNLAICYISGDVLLENCEAEEVGNCGFNELVIKNFPEQESLVKERRVRKDLLFSLPPNDSLSYLEAQVDFLTLVIMVLLKNNPELKEKLKEIIPNHTEFLEVLEESSVYNIKPADYCLEEIIKGKTKVRKRQEEYYESKENS